MDPIVVTSPLDSVTLRSRAPLPNAWRIALAAWVALALGLAASGAFAAVRALVPVALVASIAGVVIGWRRSPGLPAFTAGLDVRVPILFHLVRVAFGALFLVELGAGRLPEFFALKAGVGDIIAGSLAVVAAIAAGGSLVGRGPGPTPLRRALVLGWCALGLVDIIAVVVTAQVGLFVYGDPLLGAALPRLPYAILPTIVVPLVVLTHLLVIQRVRARGAQHSG